MIRAEEASIIRFGVHEDLCSFHCPFVKIVDSDKGFCLLFRCVLKYIDTGNNEMCYRSPECLQVRGKE